MSSIVMKSTKRVNGVEINRVRIIPKNKYSKIYQDHKSNMDKDVRPSQDCFESEPGMIFESQIDNTEKHATSNT